MCRYRFVTLIAILILLLCSQKGWTQEKPVEERWTPSPSSAAFKSLFIPGWGQAYVGKPLKAVIYGGIEQTLIFSIYRKNRLYDYYDRRGDGDMAGAQKEDRNRLSWYLGLAIIVSMMDAYVDAHLYNFEVSDDFSAHFETDNNSGFRLGNVNVNFSLILE